MQDFTLHTHTIGFDGQNTPAEMIACARDVGLHAIGISNHFIVHPNVKRANFYRAAKIGGYPAIYSESFEEAIDKFAPHYAELSVLAADAGIKVYRGMEVDFFETPGWANGFSHACEILQPDYLIGAVHLIEYNQGLCNMHDIKAAPLRYRTEMVAEYWRKVVHAAESGLFAWMAHIDLPKKVDADDDVIMAHIHEHVISRIAKSGTAIEINNSRFDRGMVDPHPSRSIMEMVAQHNIPVVISDDAHQVAHVGRHFVRGEQFGRDCGVKNFLTLQKILDFRHKTI